jgi:hypothetical protein
MLAGRKDGCRSERAVQNGRQWQGRGTRAAAQARAGRAAAGVGEGEQRGRDAVRGHRRRWARCWREAAVV